MNCEYFLSYLNLLDLFKFPIRFRFKNQLESTTWLGKIWTFFIVAYIIYSVSTSNYIQKINPKTSNQDLQSTNGRSYMNFTTKELSLIVGLTDISNHFIQDPTLFHIMIYQTYENLSSGTREDRPLEIITCEPSSFDDPSTFYKLGLNKY